MSFIEHDIVVVGGGPAGLLSAIAAAELGKKVVLFESRSKIGEYEHCAGLLSYEGLKKLGLSKLPPDVVQNGSIVGSHIHSPSGKTITVSKKKETACVVDRSLFNIYLSGLAKKEGVDIQTSSKINSLRRKEKLIELKLGKKQSYSTNSSKIVILAEGRFPRLNQQLGLPFPRRDRVVFASQYIMSNVKDIDINFVELYQTNKYAPGFFVWIIPINETTVKIGLGSKHAPSSKYLDLFIKNHSQAKIKLKDAVVEKRMSGAIPIGSFISKTYGRNTLVVGDAAGQTKPTTGGGVILGGIAAQISGKVASEAIDENNQSARFLSRYEKLWKKEMRRNLTIMKHVRFYLNSLSTDNIERLFSLVGEPKTKELISEFGDVDNQKTIVYRLLLKYRFWPFLAKTGLKYLFSK
ncbi:MAG: NAD(P)/FAD-dependent oxidoreductase [Candidatus Heimdallarchaeota archaeon]